MYTPIRTLALVLLLVLTASSQAEAHCDTMDGPVVKAGQKALVSSDLDYALIWVKPEAETELRAAFKKALAVRKLDANARDLADTYFLETLVRLHRAGEGAPYTGLEPAGTDLGPAIPAADAAIESGSPRALRKLLADAVDKGLDEHFARVKSARTYKPHDIAAGRRFVESYVLYVHFVERLYESATTPVEGHAPEQHHESH